MALREMRRRMKVALALVVLTGCSALRVPASRRNTITGAAAALALKPALASGAVADKVGADGRLVLTDTTAATIDILVTPPVTTARCFLDISIGGLPAGRIVVDVFGELTP